MANKLRVVYNNFATSATVTASTTAGTLIASNLKTASKSDVWRSTAGTTASITSVLDTTRSVNTVTLANCNLSSTATFVVKLYNASDVLTYTSSAIAVTGDADIDIPGLTAVQVASAYAYGGGRHATAYIPTASAKKVVIDISDAGNVQGYLEAATIVIGSYFTPTYDAEIGVALSYEDTGKNYRSDAGNLMTDMGTLSKLISINLEALLPADRTAVWNLVRYVGTSYPVYIDLHPEDADKDIQQAHRVFGKFTKSSQISAKAYNVYTAPLEIEGI